MNTKFTTKHLLILTAIAYAFSFLIRMIWVWHYQDNPAFYWNDQMMINTNDGYFFASGAQKELFGMHINNPRVYGIWDYGVIFFTTLLAKITPFSLETIILYMPSVISSLVVIPIILIANLYNKPIWGFISALLGSIAWSYYNRTMTGYYDTDMFSAMAPMFILYFLIKSTHDFNLRSALYASIAIILYPFLYDQGLAIIYAMGIIYGAYMIWYHKESKVTYASLILIFLSLMPLKIDAPLNYIIHLALLAIVYILLNKKEFQQKELMIASGLIFVVFLLMGNVFGLIIGKIFSYIITGTKQEGLHFFAVNQTVREAGHIPFTTFANRISGSILGLFIASLGYILLVIKHRAFILALPLVGIGIFANWGGLRFTVYAVPVAAMSAIYFIYIISDFIKDTTAKYAFIALASLAIIYPNIKHVTEYMPKTVFSKAEVKDLVKLNKIASDKDYTISWWDYGYPIWYYSDTSTLIDGGKHNNDNFIVSTIFQTTSPYLAANLSRLAVETYQTNGHKVIANTLFKNKQKDQIDPNEFLLKLDDKNYKLPKKTRDIYLYMPRKMVGVYNAVVLFGNLDLTTGKQLHKTVFYKLYPTKEEKGQIYFQRHIKFDTHKGIIYLNNQKIKIKQFVIAKDFKNKTTKVYTNRYYQDGKYIMLYSKTYHKFILMDENTFNSVYVQMFFLGRYDHNLFELVISSPYSKIYKLKI